MNYSYTSLSRHISRWLLVAVLFWALVLPQDMPAQWVLKSAPEFGGGAVRAFAEASCASSPMILAGTTEGMYLDIIGGAVYGEWIPVNTGFPTNFREIRSIAVRDSLVIVGLYGDGAYATIISPGNIPSCRPRPWIKFGTGLLVPFINDLEMRDSLLLAATDDGVWFMQPVLDTALTFEQNAAALQWRRLDNSFSNRVNAIDGEQNYLYAGTFLDGAAYYDRTCMNSTTASCIWLDATSDQQFDHVSVYDIKSAFLDTTFQHSSADFPKPCSGVFIATAGSENLFFAPYFNDSLPAPPDKWVNVSPSRSNPQWNWKINTILAGDFPGAPHSVLVGAEYGGVYISEDCGTTWREVNTATNNSSGLHGTDVRTLALVRDSIILAGVDGAGVFQGNTFAQALIGSLARQVATGVNLVTTADTNKPEMKFRVVANNGDVAKVIIEFPEDKESVVIEVYNLLAKKILDVYKGPIRAPSDEKQFDITSLPRGMYICVVQGRDFRLAQKFVVPR